MTATGPTGSPSYSKPGNHGSFEPIWANASYTLDEVVPAGQAGNYTAGTWTCDKNVSVSVAATVATVNLAKDTEVTCEITNTRDRRLRRGQEDRPGAAPYPATGR